MSSRQAHTVQALDKDQRLKAYLEKLQKLKDRQAIREVMERELLLECIRVNQPHINEYPLLTKQQESIIEIFFQRSREHPGYDFVKGMSASFIGELNKHHKGMVLDDRAMMDETKIDIFNTESLLVKCVQGIVYATALAVDNFSEVIIRYFGAESLDVMDEIIEAMHLNEKFWKEHVDRFITDRVAQTYRDMVANNRYQITRRGNMLLIIFAFDDILDKLQRTSKEIEKTRVQNYFEDDAQTDEALTAREFVERFLMESARGMLSKDASAEAVAFLARIASIDQVGLQFVEDLRKEAAAAAEENDDELDEKALERKEKQKKFVRDQVLAICLGADIAMNAMQEDFLRAVAAFSPREIAELRSLIANFEIESLERALFFMLESHFLHFIGGKGEALGNKTSVRTARSRRIPVDAVASMAKKGLTKIRKNKLFEPDPANDEMMLFRMRKAMELEAAMDYLQITGRLEDELRQLWDYGPVKVDFIVVLNLGLIAKATTNLKARLAEILQYYEIGGPKKTASSQAARNEDEEIL